MLKRIPLGINSNNPLNIPVYQDPTTTTIFEDKCDDGSCFEIKFNYVTYESGLYHNGKPVRPL